MAVDPIIPCLISPPLPLTSTYNVPSYKNTSILYQVECLSRKEPVEAFCELAKRGCDQWSGLSFTQRIGILKTVIDKLKLRRQELIQLLLEIGVPQWFADFNAENVITQLEDYITQIANPSGLVINTLVDLAITVRCPIGPVLAIPAWNAPGVLSGRTISAPLAAGCSVIIKTSELSTKCTYIIVKCFHEGGVPIDVLQMVNVKPEDNSYVVEEFIKNRHIRKISFTGSTQIGRQIAGIAGQYLKPCLLELGGKNCIIIENDADIPKAIETCLFGAWGHKGQICMAIDEIFVQDKIYQQVVEQLKIVGKKFLQDPDFQLPQRTPKYATSIKELVGEALQRGASLVIGSNSGDGLYEPITPMILENVNPKLRITETEIFGPVACLYKYYDIEDVIREINNGIHGLKASIWSKNVFKAQKMAMKIESGGVHINGTTIFDEATAPHGGVKSSGYGRFNSKWGIEEFSYVKLITMNE